MDSMESIGRDGREVTLLRLLFGRTGTGESARESTRDQQDRQAGQGEARQEQAPDPLLQPGERRGCRCCLGFCAFDAAPDRFPETGRQRGGRPFCAQQGAQFFIIRRLRLILHDNRDGVCAPLGG